MRSSVFFPLKGLFSPYVSFVNSTNSEQPDKDTHTNNKVSKNIPNFFKLCPPTNSNLQVDLILLLDEYGYPPVTLDDVYKEVLEQAENFKKYAG